MSAFLDISTGAGLASATGIRPYLPPLLAGALARGDIAIDFDGTGFSFLESPAFLGGVVAVGVVPDEGCPVLVPVPAHAVTTNISTSKTLQTNRP